MKRTNIPAYLRIEHDLRKKLESGRLKPGDRMAPEYELAEEYKVSRMTLRKGLSLLVSEGYLYQVPGRGTFVTSPDDQSLEVMRKQRDKLRKMNRGVGMLIPSVTVSLYLGIVRGAEDACRENGFHLVLGNYDGVPEKEKEYLSMFADRGISGLIVAPSYNSNLNNGYRNLVEKKIPVVLTGLELSGLTADLVATDYFNSAYLGIEHLVRSGSRKIVSYASQYVTYASREKVAGFREALRKNNLEAPETFFREVPLKKPLDPDETIGFFRQEEVDGIFSGNESTTIKLINFLNLFAGRLPRKIRLVCFDRPMIVPQSNTPVAYIIQPTHEIGRTAVNLLMARIKEKRTHQPQPYKKVLLQPKIQMSDEEPAWNLEPDSPLESKPF